MIGFGPDQALGVSALIAGLLLVSAGLHARRKNRLNTRQGAEVAGFAAFMGIVSMAAGAAWLVQSG